MKKIHIKKITLTPQNTNTNLSTFEMGIKLLNPFGVINFIVPTVFNWKIFSKIRNFCFLNQTSSFFLFLNTMYLKQLWVSQLFIFIKKYYKLNEGISYSKIIDQQDELDQNFNVYHQQNFNEFQSNKHQAFRIYKNDFEKEIIKIERIRKYV